MAANYLHGVETIEVERGRRVVRAVKTAVIALVGIAPTGLVQQPVLSLSEIDAAMFGPELPGFTIPQALRVIYNYGAGTVIVINALDPAIHKTLVAAEAITLDAGTGRVKLAHGAVAELIVKSSDGSVTHAADVDYTINALSGELGPVIN